MAKTHTSGQANNIPKLLTEKNFVDLQHYHNRNETAALERGLLTFDRIYERSKKDFNNYIRRCTLNTTSDPLNEQSKNFLLAIQFLRNFQSHYHELCIEDPQNRKTVRKEVMGLMATILQVIMNAKNLTDTEKTRVRTIFFWTHNA